MVYGDLELFELFLLFIVCRIIACKYCIMYSMSELDFRVQKDFGAKVRKRREKLGISQEKFAEIVGLHRTYIGMVERGEKNISLINITKIAQGLEVTVSELFNTMVGDENEEEN